MPLADLSAFARDLWWTTTPEADRLWSALAPDAWAACQHNPTAMLPHVADISEELKQEIDAWIGRWPRGARPSTSPTSKRIAYFCMEFGIHESLPIYSGGLGMLAGDHIRSAADLGIDLVAVGLLYRQGYFQQRIQDGAQVVHYQTHDPRSLPIRPVLGRDGKPIRIQVPDGKQEYAATAWEARIGHVRLFLIDTNLPENPEPIRDLTARLYGGDERTRLHQEVLLGFGGKQLLDLQGIQPEVFHMNEGHAAFLVTALLTEAVAHGTSPADAWVAVRDQCVFTTHTPVPAGHDRFHTDHVRAVLDPTCSAAGLSFEEWAAPAIIEEDQFCMSTLAIRGSRAINGVSKLHSQVSQEMFGHLGIEVQPITNGVHPTAWLAEETANLFEKNLPGWREHISDGDFWKQADAIPTEDLIGLRKTLRKKLISAARLACNDPDILDEDRLTIGFARRFAPYKRANLIFTQPDRLAALLERGAQIIFAGKAHPRDLAGQALIEEVIRWSEDPRFKGRIVFIPGYDPSWGRLLTAGCDVWLNNPQRPREASGTSGQKAALNGNPNLSVLDGWWPEAADGTNGWSIQGVGDVEDALELYQLLEDIVMPAFASNEKWATIMRRNLTTCVPVFNTDRMLKDYCAQLYEPEDA